jgi:myo-inositol-hexaphosphate 3-phosphohydrolase
MAVDEEGEFLFVGEKNGSVKIWNMGSTQEGDTLKQTIDTNTSLNGLSFEPKYFSVISLATGRGLLIRDIKGNTDIFKFQPEAHVFCLSLCWDANSI